MPPIETPDVQSADSSPAIEVPRDSAAYAEWRQTGVLPAPKDKPTSGSPDGANSSAESSAPPKGEKTAPGSEPGKGTQENRNKPKDGAAARLNELLEDLRKAGMTPAELKTFKREQQKTDQQKAEPPAAAAEKTGNPAELKAPVKPKQEDFKTYEELEAAREKYQEDYAAYVAAKAVQDYRASEAQKAVQQTVHEKMLEAKTRYGDEAIGIIISTARALTSDQQVPPAVRQILDQSPVWTDLLYTIGGTPAELDAFMELAKSDPGAAIRKVVLMEQLVTQELAKGGKPGAGKPADGKPSDNGEGDGEPPRDGSGKFRKTPPENKESNTPPPPREVSGRGSQPPDPVDQAVKTGDFRSFRNNQNEKDLRRLRR